MYVYIQIYISIYVYARQFELFFNGNLQINKKEKNT